MEKKAAPTHIFYTGYKWAVLSLVRASAPIFTAIPFIACIKNSTAWLIHNVFLVVPLYLLFFYRYLRYYKHIMLSQLLACPPAAFFSMPFQLWVFCVALAFRWSTILLHTFDFYFYQLFQKFGSWKRKANGAATNTHSPSHQSSVFVAAYWLQALRVLSSYRPIDFIIFKSSSYVTFSYSIFSVLCVLVPGFLLSTSAQFSRFLFSSSCSKRFSSGLVWFSVCSSVCIVSALSPLSLVVVGIPID